MSNDKRIRVVLHLSAGGLVVLTGILTDYILPGTPEFGLHQSIALAVGLLMIALGFFPNLRYVSNASTNTCLSVLSLFVTLAVCEGLFRAVGFDFSREEQAWRRIPPYYRQPIVPTGEVFFRRPGPQSWSGQVINTRMAQLNIAPNPYVDEPEKTITYNKTGFRSADDILEWDIAVAGDSFTELGHLQDEELFTTILGNDLNVNVMNLGTAYTGPLTQLSYLRDYGIPANIKVAVIVFFEGNDLRDLASEYEALMRWQQNGQRDVRQFKRQSSTFKALYQLVSSEIFGRLAAPTNIVNAYFKSSDGDMPVSLDYAPPGKAEISPESVHHLNYFFSEYAALATGRQITGWLAFMPSKRRVLDSQIEFTTGALENIAEWQPRDLPEFIGELCQQYGIRFMDLTPALIMETSNEAHLVYNSVFDTHLNAFGSQVVAREMGRHLATDNLASPNASPNPTP